METATTSHNIDQNEVNKFNDLAYRWWDTEGELKTLHQINPLRLQFILQHCSLKGKRAIDVGCGGGILSEALASAGATTTGIDMAETSLEVAGLHLLESGLTVQYEQCLAEQYAEQQTASFDIVTCMEMLEHVPDPVSIVEACSQMLKPGGLAFFSTLDRNPKSYIHAILGAEYLLKLLPKGTHDYRKFIRPAELSNWMRGTGLEAIAIAGISYNPVFKTYRLSQDTSVNYLVAAVKT